MSRMNDPTSGFIFRFGRGCKNQECGYTHICGSHVSDKPELVHTALLKGKRERVRQRRRSDRKENRKKRGFEVKGTKGKWDLGAKGRKEREVLGT